MSLPFISIITDSTGNYTSVKFSGVGGSVKMFATGDICRDYLDCLILSRQFHAVGLPVMLSSSVDHWCFDNPDFCWGVVEAQDGNKYETIIKIN